MIAGVEPSLLHEQASDLLGTLGELRAGEALRCRAPVVQQSEECVVGGSGGAPAQDFGDELVLFAATAGLSTADGFILQAADVSPGGGSQAVAL
jgi:hypothetical protein